MKKIMILSAIAMVGIIASATTVDLSKCVGCHGSNFQKSALGKSKIVKDLSLQEIKTALNGYKNGTYGGPMKAIMQGQVKSIANVDVVAEAIYERTHHINDKQSNNLNELAPLTKADKKCVKKCSVELDSIKKCINNAKDQGSMHKCRVALIKLANKIQEKFNIRIDSK